MLHPLHTPEFVANYIAYGGGHPQERRTGRSTALALKYIAEAIENPRQPVQIRDHHDVLRAHRDLFERVREMVRQLGLEHMVFREHGNTVTFTD